MEIVRTVEALRGWSRAIRMQDETVGLVPTMGALHAGHASLMRAAAEQCGHVAVTIFVNPTQFGPQEDFDRYPRTFEADCMLAEREGARVVFAPPVEEMYPAGAATFVDVEGLSGRLDGASRPGHFRGVATVVAKLLIAAEADRAYFGQKDAAQVAVLRRMVRDLHFRTELVVCPIVREDDGLAMSSRNGYLLPDEHEQALVLHKTLRVIQSRFAEGERSAERLLSAGLFVMAYEPTVRIDYLKVVNPKTLEDVSEVEGRALVVLAAFVGGTRLIDNVLLEEPFLVNVIPAQA